MPHLLERLSARKRAIFSILPAGLALKNNGNIAAALHIDRVFAIPVMLSGLNSLVLNRTERDILNRSHLNMLIRLLKLFDKTPHCFVFLTAGCLPAEVLLNLRILGLFGMICLLPDNIFYCTAI